MNKLALLFVPLLLATRAFAQANFPEIEPNSNKAAATAVTGITAGDMITGLTTGAVTTIGSTASTTADMFRIKTSALPLGIYRHRLTLSTSTTSGHTGTLRGVNQTGTVGVGGTAGTVDTALQTSITTSSPPRFNQWFGFGRQEEIYYRVAGTGTTTAEYTATMSTATVSPTVIAPVFESGSPITFTTIGQTTADTELMLFDAALTAIPGGLNDDEGPAGLTTQSRLTRTLAPGTYYLAVATFELSSNQVAPPDEDFQQGLLTDFPDCVVLSSSSLLSVDWDFQIIAANLTFNQANQTAANNPYTVTWFQFTTAALAPTSTTPFCVGDLTTCPCFNPGASGNGCASASFAAGAQLAASGLAGASVGTDTLVLTATNIPGPGLFFQANGLSSMAVLGDGLLCASVGIIRLGMGMPSGGTASYPNLADPTPIHITASTQSGDTRHYQTWYRTVPSLCGAGNYNLTQGLTLTWSQ